MEGGEASKFEEKDGWLARREELGGAVVWEEWFVVSHVASA